MKKHTHNLPDSLLPLHENLGFAAMEQYKLLRTNLNFVLPEGEKCPVIGITSSVRGEGKSTTAVNLAYVLAADKKKVLLIDGDLRLPSIAKKMDVQSTPGLTNLLVTYDVENLDQFRSKVLDRWYVMPSGPLPPNPSELLGSPKMAKLLGLLREKFDYIILDLPPVSVVSDALAVSRLISGMILVIREDYTDKRELETCVRQLDLANVKVFGCVWNETKEQGAKKYKYKRYSGNYRYGYYGREKGNKRPSAI